MCGKGKVGRAYGCGIASAAGCADRYDWKIAARTFGEEKRFVSDVVDRVEDGSERNGEEFGSVLGSEEFFDGGDATFGVDAEDAFAKDFNFGFADFGGKGGELPVDVADANFVEIDEGERTDTAAGEGFEEP